MTMKLKFVALGTALTLFAPFTVNAAPADDSGAQLTLKTTAAKSEYIIDGALWRCEGLTCRASNVEGIPAIYACMHAAEELGAISEFVYQGETLSADKLAKCNVRAKT